VYQCVILHFVVGIRVAVLRLRVHPLSTGPYAATVTEERGAWTTYGERLIYDNQWVRLGLADVEAPNGERWEYHVVHLARIAIGLVVDERDRVLMLWRYRFPTDQWGYELLGGLVEGGEDPADTARREVEEETGYRPIGQPEHLVSFEPLPGQVTADTDVYLWRKVEKVGEPTDTEEVGRLEWVPLSRVLEFVQRREVLGAGALVPLLYYLASRGAGAASGQDEAIEPA
jgi:ADP-ribose diphosphatase